MCARACVRMRRRIDLIANLRTQIMYHSSARPVRECETNYRELVCLCIFIHHTFHLSVPLQRDARGSVTFKIVPSYRSAPPPCEVSARLRHLSHSLHRLSACVTRAGWCPGTCTITSPNSVLMAHGHQCTPTQPPSHVSGGAHLRVDRR